MQSWLSGFVLFILVVQVVQTNRVKSIRVQVGATALASAFSENVATPNSRASASRA